MFDIQEELKKLPDKPGVYLMKDKNGDVIYVGKAVVLKNRVRQYFHPSTAHTPKVAAMVEKISEFECIVTDTELEALILECNLIKDLKPKYNILLRDDKNYPYIKVTMNEEYPRIFMTRRVEDDGACYFGPYSNVFSVRETINLIRRIFPVRSCKRVLPRDIGKGRPCLYYHIRQCLAPCSGKIDKDEYRSMMQDVCSFLDGKQDMVIERLERQMKEAADNLDFEQAAAIRDKLASIRHISEEQKVLSVDGADRDIIGFAANKTDTCVQVFFIRKGKLLGREFFIIEGSGEGELAELASSFLKQFYGDASVIPPEIIAAVDFDDIRVVEDWLSSKRGGRVRIRVPKRGEKLHLAEMVSENARIELERFSGKTAEGKTVKECLEELASILGLPEPPVRLEAYDISNTGSSEMVASMVVFTKGLPDKKEYRRFKIRSVDVQNDYASMQEALYRRFRRAMKDKQDKEEGHEVNHDNDGRREKKREGFENLPDLVMLDGGLGHVNAAKQVLEELNISIPVCGMVKDDRHRTRGLVLPDREIDLKDNIALLRFVTSIQDEAHRFALDYNKKLRAKRYSKSILDEVEGIGPKRKKALLRHFGSLSRIRQAGIDDLQAVEGMNRTAAEKLYEFLRRR
ncbi:MAG: excinuclease ABC subunit UvrC [Acetivibrionales bacterium]|jgi:excinuclease ABC subunit C